MSHSRVSIAVIALAILAGVAEARDRAIVENSASPHATIKSVDIDAVRWTHGFWADRFELVRNVTIPTMWDVMQKPRNAASFVNLKIAAGIEKGKFGSVFWSDGDVYKWIETVAYVYALTRDPQLDRRMDEAIGVIARAQAPDGYISTQIQLTDVKRWTHFRYHELYNMGHLITAACVHNRVTGKDNFLKVAVHLADYLYTVFRRRPPELAHFGFNPSQIMALTELYRTTHDPKYLELAGTFVDMRGSQPGGTDENQTRVRLREETEAVGHSVTGPYLWAGATDVYAETGEKTLFNALERIWTDVVRHKMYVNGGVAAINMGVSYRRDPIHEAFGLPFQLPNSIAYNETCANIAHAMWSWRMLGVTGDAKYADVMELVLYNTMLSGWGLDGRTYCYTNPLRWHGREDRLLRCETYERWPDTLTPGAPNCYCCPPNVSRTVAGLNGWAYGVSQRALWVNLYGSNTIDTELPGGGRVKVAQETAYPWDGAIKFTIQTPGEFALMLRIPAWSPGASIKVNGKPFGAAPKSGAYAEVRRVWKAGDTVELVLAMNARLVQAHPKVEEARSQVAVMRGPLVYCLESTDLPVDVKVSEIAIPADIKLAPRYDAKLLNGVAVLEGQARIVREGNWSGLLYRSFADAAPQAVNLKLIPYYSWNNRGVPHMTVWLPVIR